MVEMGENDMSPENEVKNPSRRRFLKTGLASAAAIGAGYFLGNEISRVNPLDTKEKRIDELTHDELFGKLRSKIEDSSGSDDEKKQALEVFADLKKIVDVNDTLVSLMNAEVDSETGEPRLIALNNKIYEPLHLEDPSSMLFIVSKDRDASRLIIEPVVQYLSDNTQNNNSSESIYDTLAGLKKGVEDDDGRGGEFKYIDRDWPHMRLYDFLTVGSETGGKIEIGPAKEVTSEEGKASLASDLAHANEVLRNVAIPGDTNIKLWSAAYQNDSVYPDPRSEGKFLEFGDTSFILLSSNSAQTLGHEVGHHIDPRMNDTQILKHMTPEGIYKLMVESYEALANKEWGINYTSIEEVFSRKEKFIPAITFNGKGDSIEAPKLGDIRKPLDHYPDMVFITGSYPTEEINNQYMIRKSDMDLFSSTRELFREEGVTSATLEEFLNKEENQAYFEVIKGKSEWQGEIISQLRNLAPILDGKLEWLRTTIEIDKVPHEIISVPKAGSKDSEWFDFYSSLGQRIAILDMFFKKSKALGRLAGSDYDDFKFNLTKSYIMTSYETFAHMFGMTLVKFNKEIKSDSPNPYRDVIKVLDDELKDKNKTSVMPNKSFIDALIPGSKVANV